MLPVALVAFPVIMYYRQKVSETVISLSGYEEYGLIEGAGTYTFTALLLMIAIIVWLRMGRVITKDESTRPYFNAFLLAIIITPLTWVNPSAMRAVQYYSIFLLVMIPFIVDSFDNSVFNLRKLVYITSIVVLFILFIRAAQGMEYRFFWQEMELGPNYPRGWTIID